MCPVAVKNSPDFPVAPVPSTMGIHAVTYELSKLFTIIPNTIKKSIIVIIIIHWYEENSELLTEKNLLLYKCVFFLQIHK